MNRTWKQFKGCSGQSIVEAIIATSIVATAVASALTLTTASLNAQKDNEGWMIATNLAREGVEVVRNIRDSNWLAGLDWDEGLEGADNDYTAIAKFDPMSGEWLLDFVPDTIGKYGTEVWRYTNGPWIGVYTQNIGQPDNTRASLFFRLIDLNAICLDNKIKFIADFDKRCPDGKPKIGIRIRSKIVWKTGGRNRDIEVVEQIYDWR